MPHGRGLALVAGALLFVPAGAAASPAGDARKAARAAGFAAIAGQVARAAERTFVIERTVLPAMPAELGTSRLGGDPDMPPDRAWPRCGRRPQNFLMQLRVSDLPRTDRVLRRVGGWLLVFTDVRIESGETAYGLWAGDCTRVLHVPAGTGLRRTSPPAGSRHLRLAPARLRFSEHTDVPDLTLDSRRLGPPLSRVRLPNEAAERRWDTMRYRLGGRRVGDFEHRLLGYVDRPNGGEDCYYRIQGRSSDWRHLVTVNYDEEIGFMVADGGRLQVAIPAADLKAGRFTRTCGIFDSS